jgi:hypothetical protein
MSASSGRAPGFPSSNGLIRLTQAENLPVEHQKLQAQILKDLVTGKSLESALEHSCTTRVAAEGQTIDSVILEAENHLALMAFLGAQHNRMEIESTSNQNLNQNFKFEQQKKRKEGNFST